MQRTISPEQLSILNGVADHIARRTRHRLGLPAHDIGDLRQDLLLDMIARFPAFDPECSPLEAFAHMVARHRTSRIGQAVWRERQLFGRAPLSLDMPIPGENNAAFVGDLFSNEDGLAGQLGQSFNFEDEVLTRSALDAGLSELEPDERQLCIALITSTIDGLSNTGHGARATIFRRLKDIRNSLLAHGVAPA